MQISRSIEAGFRNYILTGLAVFFAVGMALACPLANAQTAQQSDEKVPPVQITEQPQGKSFHTPGAAAAALYAAACRNDEKDLLAILGPNSKELIMWTDDAEVRKEHHQEFMRKYDQMHRLVREPDNTVALYVGSDNWPMPIPLVEYKGAWYFDADLGKQEVMYRRIGRNEMEALQVCSALVDAEKEYFAKDQQYTTKFVSTAGSHDGLYWGGPDSSAKSPIGPYLAHAGIDPTATTETEKPYHGYYYRIVSSQGASGDKASAFAIVAFPADYRMSGVMTFIMDQNGNAYEKDLGQSTDQAARAISSFAPDSSWKKVE
jgi:hypothetical protein